MPLRRAAISAFIAFHLLAISAWLFPFQSPMVEGFKNVIRPYMFWTGLFQKWDMFAPDPSKINNYVGAVVTFRDGSSHLWLFPRMETLGYTAKYFKERYRKYANDNLRLDENAALWPDAARYIARVNNSRPSDPPATISLVRYWSFVPPPDPNGIEQNGPWQQYTFYRYQVTPGDLQ